MAVLGDLVARIDLGDIALTRAALDPVALAVCRIDRVVAALTAEYVLAGPSVDCVVPASTLDLVSAVTGVDRVGAGSSPDPVRSVASVDRVVAGSSEQAVVGTQARDLVVTVAADEEVDLVGADERTARIRGIYPLGRDALALDCGQDVDRSPVVVESRLDALSVLTGLPDRADPSGPTGDRVRGVGDGAEEDRAAVVEDAAADAAAAPAATPIRIGR